MTPVVTFFDSAVDVGTTWLVYHLAWMYAAQGRRVLAVDLDPDAALTRMLVGEGRAAALFEASAPAAAPAGVRWSIDPHVEAVASGLSLLVGGPREVIGDVDSAGVALRALLAELAASVEAEVVLIDVRAGQRDLIQAGLVASDHVVVVLDGTPYSLAGLQELGTWLQLPGISASPGGYLIGHASRSDFEVGAGRAHWLVRVLSAYGALVAPARLLSATHRLGTVRDYPSLAAMAREARKPIFQLRAADGAIGSHAAAAQQAFGDFQELADRVAKATWRGAGDPSGS